MDEKLEKSIKYTVHRNALAIKWKKWKKDVAKQVDNK